jgi:hypothetical protein
VLVVFFIGLVRNPKPIEKGSWHNASFIVGKLLGEIYWSENTKDLLKLRNGLQHKLLLR